jgi:hypothetical protein
MEEGEEKERKKKRGKKKSLHAEGGLPQGWTTLLAVQRVTAVRCN